MLIRIAVIALICLPLAPLGRAQNRDADSQTLREILVELRASHEDMRVTETTQLLVAELEMQQGVVNRATEDADNARSRLSDCRLDQKHVDGELQTLEEHLDKSSNADEKMPCPPRLTGKNQTSLN